MVAKSFNEVPGSMKVSAQLLWQPQKQREHWEFLAKEKKTKPAAFLPQSKVYQQWGFNFLFFSFFITL